ncbi:hypothetical protein F4779DRAFT_147537 [Xylariaceae sp. FL0662B]|nr:hypothetical protein F4779DRAFT_147537 [Xylariaceae sp. FL0662B]
MSESSLVVLRQHLDGKVVLPFTRSRGIKVRVSDRQPGSVGTWGVVIFYAVLGDGDASLRSVRGTWRRMVCTQYPCRLSALFGNIIRCLHVFYIHTAYFPSTAREIREGSAWVNVGMSVCLYVCITVHWVYCFHRLSHWPGFISLRLLNGRRRVLPYPGPLTTQRPRSKWEIYFTALRSHRC